MDVQIVSWKPLISRCTELLKRRKSLGSPGTPSHSFETDSEQCSIHLLMHQMLHIFMGEISVI